MTAPHTGHVFVTGGSGLTGPAVVAELIAAGHGVTGLARSDAAAARLESLGAVPHRGSLDDLDSLRRGAEAADGVLHMAFGGDFADPDGMIRRDRTAIETLGRALGGSGRPFVSTSGTLVMPAGRVGTEQDEPETHEAGPECRGERVGPLPVVGGGSWLGRLVTHRVILADVLHAATRGERPAAGLVGACPNA